MSTPSSWPLPPGSIRFVVPRPVVQQLSEHPLSQSLYPQGIGYYREAAGHHMERPYHDDNLLLYCLDGGAELRVGEHQYRIQGGDLILLPRGTSHSYQAHKRHPWTIYWVHFQGLEADAFVRHLHQPRQQDPALLLFPLGIHSRVVTDFETLLEVREATFNLNAYLCAANQLRQILSYIALLQPFARQQDSRGRLDLERVHSLMQERVHGHLNLANLAASVNLSKYHFVKKYKELTGTTPIDHFIRLKIERSCHLLDVTSKSIGEIARAAGYEDPYYFSRIFKKVMGISPTQYRQIRSFA